MKSEVVLFESLRGFPPGGIQRLGCCVIANRRFVRMGTDSYGELRRNRTCGVKCTYKAVAGQIRWWRGFIPPQSGGEESFPPGGIQRRGCCVIANWRFVRMGTDSYGELRRNRTCGVKCAYKAVAGQIRWWRGFIPPQGGTGERSSGASRGGVAVLLQTGVLYGWVRIVTDNYGEIGRVA